MPWQFLGEVLGVAPDEPGDDVARWFLAGYSLQQVAAMLQPGLGGPALIQALRDVEDQLRHYVLHIAMDNESLAQELQSLRQEVARLKGQHR